jgi:phenylacetate-CoA ligase
MKIGLNSRLKGWMGARNRGLIRDAWGFGTEEFWEYQAAALARTLRRAIDEVPYYRARRDAYEVDLRADDLPRALARLPVLGKPTVRADVEQFQPSPRLPMTTYHRTSGTTGSPLKLAGTLPERGFSHNILEDWTRRVLGPRRRAELALSGFMTPPVGSDRLAWIDPISGRAFLSIYNLNEANRPRVLRLMRRLRPGVITGYASAVHQLALLAGDALRGSRDERVSLVTSEVLQPAWRDQIEDGLCSKVYDQYGSQEGSHLAISCAHNSMHIHPLVGVIEVVDEEGRPVPAGRPGRVLVSGFLRRSMPLIRYDLGDTAESLGYATDCPCGLAWPRIGRVDGRSEDLVRTRDGRRIGYLAFHAFKVLEGVSEGQIVQTGYDRFTCNIVRATRGAVADEAIEARIREQVQGRLQGPVDIDFRYLESIPRGANGKFKAVVVEPFAERP